MAAKPIVTAPMVRTATDDPDRTVIHFSDLETLSGFPEGTFTDPTPLTP